MTTARTAVTTAAGTPATPFDQGAGRIDVRRAAAVGLVFDESPSRYLELGQDPLRQIDLNTPSIAVPVLAGAIATTRVATNVSDRRLDFDVSARGPSGGAISVSPTRLRLAAGASAEVAIRIEKQALPDGQYFGEIRLEPRTAGQPALHLPVAFTVRPGALQTTSDCAPSTIPVDGQARCSVSIENTSPTRARIVATSVLSNGLDLVRASGARVIGKRTARREVWLRGRTFPRPSLAEQAGSSFAGLASIGSKPSTVGDEDGFDLDLTAVGLPAVVALGQTITRIGVTSNGYLVLGGLTGASDISFAPQVLPDPSRPNNVLAPYWSDLDGTGSPGIYADVVGDGTGNRWLVVEWDVHVFGDAAARRHFQVWLGLNGIEDVWFAYDGPQGPGSADVGLTVGAENEVGDQGAMLVSSTGSDIVVTSAPGAPGGSVTYTVTAAGRRAGSERVRTSVVSSAERGETIVVAPIAVG